MHISGKLYASGKKFLLATSCMLAHEIGKKFAVCEVLKGGENIFSGQEKAL